MKEVVQFIAFDGTPFPSAEECLAYEADHAEGVLVGLTAQDVADAISRKNVSLADAIEKIGAQIARARLAAGDRKRKPKGAPETAAAPPATPET